MKNKIYQHFSEWTKNINPSIPAQPTQAQKNLKKTTAMQIITTLLNSNDKEKISKTKRRHIIYRRTKAKAKITADLLQETHMRRERNNIFKKPKQQNCQSRILYSMTISQKQRQGRHFSDRQKLSDEENFISKVDTLYYLKCQVFNK